MNREETAFIKETLVEAIGWAEYADDYFKEKHNLDKDKRDIDKAFDILYEHEAETGTLKSKLVEQVAESESVSPGQGKSIHRPRG